MDNELKQMRVNAGMTQEDAARLIGVSRCTFNRWEQGAHGLPALKRAGVLKALITKTEMKVEKTSHASDRKKRKPPTEKSRVHQPVYRRLLFHQDFKCAICRKCLIYSPTAEMAGDHDHKTEEPRGVLCRQCNMGLGMFKDSPEILDAAASYARGTLLGARSAAAIVAMEMIDHQKQRLPKEPCNPAIETAGGAVAALYHD